jgi:hypothetical protein
MRHPHPYRKGLPEVPTTMRPLPIDWRGFPVPFFVAWIKGSPDHRVVEPIKLMRCVRDGLCWICGRPLIAPAVCVVGPMCGVNHVSSEPPSHEACARFSVQACPFLSRPHAHRREAGLPDVPLVEAPGAMLMHNPGMSLLWWTSRVEAFKVGRVKGSHNLLFDIGDPLKVEWWTEGRPATRDEAEQAIVVGLPRLEAACEGRENELAVLHQQAGVLRRWLPAEAAP